MLKPEEGSNVRMRAGHGGPDKKAIRTDIQALRALAVSLVVIFHVWPDSLPGGFIGVDVFFVISGFLITSLLLREVEKTGRISIVRFWGRRARRILPAALATLIACALLTMLVAEHTYWQQFLSEIRAATLYVENWHLAGNAVNYFAPTSPSPVNHFWSLSVEEQFYVVWPAMILIAVLIASKLNPKMIRRTVGTTMWIVVLASLAYSVHQSTANPAAGYFETPTRVWQFGAGALLALMPANLGMSSRVRAALSWLGLGAIILAAAVYSPKTLFPGYAALVPVLGTVAVIYAGMPRNGWASTRLMSLPPFQYLGDISYSAYLWHWPLIIFLPLMLNWADWSTNILVIVGTLVIASLSKKFVEDPFRTPGVFTARRLGLTFASAAAVTSVCIALTAVGIGTVSAEVRKDNQATARLLADKPECFGAAARDPENQPCINRALSKTVVPSPASAPKLVNWPCTKAERSGRVRVCEFGRRTGETASIALVGDSHASHWRGALNVVANSRGWKGLSIAHTSCPFATGVRQLTEPVRTTCQEWNRDTLAWFKKHPEVQTVFFVQQAGSKFELPRGVRSQREAQINAYHSAWKKLPASVKNIVVIRDTPFVSPETLACIERAKKAGKQLGRVCTVPRQKALRADPAALAAKQMKGRKINVIDMTRFFCDAKTCLTVIGGVLVYKDVSHITAVYSETLGPYLLRRVDRLARSW